MTINIAIFHGNYPAQYLDIAPSLALIPQSNVFYFTETEINKSLILKGVKRIQFSTHREPSVHCHHYLRNMEGNVLRGQAAIKAINQVKNDYAFVPDVVIVHGGMGYSLFIKSAFPNARIIMYCEWYFHEKYSHYLLPNNSLDDRLRMKMTNTCILDELNLADKVVCPTRWQGDQVPVEYQSKCEVVFDGLDKKFFYPVEPAPYTLLESCEDSGQINIDKNDLVLSYVTRGMEPLRGFPQFMRAASAALSEIDNLKVIIGGRDIVCYSYKSNLFKGSWKETMLSELGISKDDSRIVFTGLMNYGDYKKLLSRSNLHCFFSYPYVVSWGLFQAVACGANLLVSNSPGFEEAFYGSVVPDNLSICLDDQSQINQKVVFNLKSKSVDYDYRIAMASQMPNELELSYCMDKWRRLVLDVFKT